MATLQSPDANILDADEINWRLIVYPILGLLVLLGAGVAFYYYRESQREDAESDARQALLAAKTPEAMMQVADHFSGTTQADFALIAAGNLALDQKNFALAEKSFARVAGAEGTDPILRDSAEVGLAAAFEADKKIDDAIKAFLTVARRGGKSGYAPYAYVSAARLYDQMKDKDDERMVLTEAVGLDTDSNFTKEASARLKAMNAAGKMPSSAPPNSPVPPKPPAPATNSPAS